MMMMMMMVVVVVVVVMMMMMVMMMMVMQCWSETCHVSSRSELDELLVELKASQNLSEGAVKSLTQINGNPSVIFSPR